MAVSDNKYSLYELYEKINGEWVGTRQYKAYLKSVDDEDCVGLFSSVTTYENVCIFYDYYTYKVTNKYKSEDNGATWNLINTSREVVSVETDSSQCGYSNNITTSSETICVKDLNYDYADENLLEYNIEFKLYFNDNTLKTLRKEKGEMYFKIVSSVTDSTDKCSSYMPLLKVTKYYYDGIEITSRRTYEQAGYSRNCGWGKFHLDLYDSVCDNGFMSYLYNVVNTDGGCSEDTNDFKLNIYVSERTSSICSDCAFIYNGSEVYNNNSNIIETFSLPSLGITSAIIPDCIDTLYGNEDYRCDPTRPLNAFVSELRPESGYYDVCDMNYCISDGENKVTLTNHSYNLNEWSFMSNNSNDSDRITSYVHFLGTVSEAYSKLKNTKILKLFCTNGYINYYGWDDEVVLYYSNKKSDVDYNIVVEDANGKVHLLKSKNGIVNIGNLIDGEITGIKFENGIKNFTNENYVSCTKYVLPSTLETLSGVTFRETDDISFNGTVEQFQNIMATYESYLSKFTVKCNNGEYKNPNNLIMFIEYDEPEEEGMTYVVANYYIGSSNSSKKLIKSQGLDLFEVTEGTTTVHKNEYGNLYEYYALKIPNSVTTLYLEAFGKSQIKSRSGVYTNYRGIYEVWFKGTLDRWKKLIGDDYTKYFGTIYFRIVVYCNDGTDVYNPE